MSVLTFLEKRLEEVIAGIGVVIMCIMVFFQVVMRYVFSLPTSWSDEIAQYCMLWSVYLSVSWAVRERAHIRVMNFINLFPLAFKNGLVVFGDFICFIFGQKILVFFGESGVAIVTRIMGLILATIGVEMLLEGLMEIVGRNKEFFL